MQFTDLPLIEPLQRALTADGYTTPTPIQEQAIPLLLQGKDLLGIAQTGTGKTAAFALPLLQRLATDKRVAGRASPRALILAPTRELVAQIGDSFKSYGKFLRLTHTTIFGGVGQGPQVNALNRGVDIVVATPGRLLDLVNQRRVRLDAVEVFVLDEADRMLDMGFIMDIKKIIAMLPKQRQSLFFSATMVPEVDSLARTMLHHPEKIAITPQATTVERIDQRILFVAKQDKDKLLLQLLEGEHLERVLVFARTKHGANKLVEFLYDKGVHADAIHGNKSQAARQKALNDFKNGKVRVLVATDIAARGIDVDGISHVINYELPNEPESYVHRIGRTARAGADGTAYSFCSSEERNFLRDIERMTRQQIPVLEHAFHDERARLATGSAASLPKRGNFGRGAPRGAPRGGSFSKFAGKARGDGGDRRAGSPRDGPRDGPRPFRTQSASRDGDSPRPSRDGPRPAGGDRRGPPRGGPRQ